MDESFNNGGKKKGLSKGIIAIIVAAVLVVGGSVAAFVIMDLSAKEKFFLAEKDTFDFITEKVEQRYEPELSWLEQTETTPTESTVELSAEYNVPNNMGGGGFGTVDPAQIINNSTITITGATDMENKKASAALKADIGGMEIDDINFYLTAEKIMVGLPFIEELLQLKDEDLGNLLKEVDPETFTGEESMNLESFFEGTNGFLSEEDQKYLEDEYAKMIYDELPESAFETVDETIKVNGESLDTEKITFNLSEEQFKDILIKTFEKLGKDEKVKELIRDQMALQFSGPSIEGEIDQLISDFETAMADAEEGIQDFQIPDGLTAISWIKDDLIVQRDFQIEMGPSTDELVSFAVKGSQLLEDTKQFFNYDLSFSDSIDQGTMNISGNLSWEDNKADDSINLTADQVTLSYEGTESLKDGKRDFERVFSVEDPSFGGGSLIWSGNATYDNDKMSSEHNLSIESPEVSQDMFTLNVLVDGQTIESVELPNEDNVKDLGSMSVEEITDYFELEVTPQVQQWMFGILAGSGNMGF
ncbi:hypothetical protein CIL05_08130 [Virgibacillus profundi]|uniref:DUF945 domain-containing protein n=1 Tax=Virgibacillus profundi TaxID=2024555 RepID=A0A2A2IH01_9BACI|nr:DUF6583 family protein [Virgibacillus profundi]PAV30430.1 hypothetical protein CIL05_08130 [Virgibacillus profundi]PXY54602.1 hypothetical protein CIT14_08215 [Virgibacillus profundi]